MRYTFRLIMVSDETKRFTRKPGGVSIYRLVGQTFSRQITQPEFRISLSPVN